MSKLKIAILEDSKLLLKEMKLNLEETGLVRVIVYAQKAEDFIGKVNATKIDAVVLDIDLAGDSMSGLDVASHLNKPVLFATGKTKKYIIEIEEHNLQSDLPVEHITKPVSKERLERILPKFIQRIKDYKRNTTIRLDFAGSKNNQIPLDQIVYVETEEGDSGKSMNKRMFFENRNPETIIDKSFRDLEKLGLVKHRFIQTHKSYRVNVDKIKRYNKSEHELVVLSHVGGRLIECTVPVSRNYQSKV